MPYINAASSITCQPSFGNPDFFSGMKEIGKEADLICPDFKEFIDPKALRRLSQILRISLTSALDCLAQSQISQPEALIVGTGLGALEDTEKFLRGFLTAGDALVPPTSFIQSTHNTIAGQLSIVLKNHSYNMTHTQNSLSFEMALQDALLCLDEGMTNVLIGAADERIDFLDTLVEMLDVKPMKLTSGSSFFVLSNEKSQNAIAVVSRVATYGLTNLISKNIHTFLQGNGILPEDVDLLLFTTLDRQRRDEIQQVFENCKKMDYTPYCGVYMTSSAFAMHCAVDAIAHRNYRRVLICNVLIPENLGLILIEKL